MVTKKLIKEELNTLATLSEITNAYAVISSIRMKHIRDSVLKNREFLDSLSKVFQEVLISYRREILEISKRNKHGITFLSHNGRTVCVFLAANARFYGEVLYQTFELFDRESSNQDLELTIIGRHGLRLFRDKYPNKAVTFFDFPDNSIDLQILSKIIEHLVQYEEIRIYYPKFENIINQTPTVFKVSASEFFRPGESQQIENHYLFEPDLPSIMKYFETQVFGSLIEQTVRESQLAKTASRLFSMDRASQRIQSRINRLKIDSLALTHSEINKKQLSNIATYRRI